MPSRGHALGELIRARVVKSDDGDLQVPTEVLEAIRAERVRAAAIPRVPSTPRHLMREGGGVGVGRGGSGAGHVTALSFEALRRIRKRGALFQAIHAARAYQVRAVSRKWQGQKTDVGWHVVHKDYSRSNTRVPEGFQRWIDRFEKILEHPAPYHGCKTTSSLMVRLVEDLLTINHPAVEVLHSAVDPDRVVGFRPIDGATVWPTLFWVEKWMAEHPNHGQKWAREELSDAQRLEIVSQAMGHDLFDAEFCIVRDGMLDAIPSKGRVLCAPLENSTDIEDVGYPQSHVEQALEMGVAFIAGWDFNTSYFTRGMFADIALGVVGEYGDDSVQAFRDQLTESAVGLPNAHSVPVIGLADSGDLVKIDLRKTNQEMMFPEWLSLVTSLGAAVYRMDMSTINGKPWSGGGSPALSEGSRSHEIQLAKEEGLQADMQHVVDHFLIPLARRCHPDLRVVVEYGEEDQKVLAELYSTRSKTEMTRNEVRIAQDMKPLGFWAEDYDALGDEDKKRFDDNIWNMPADPTFVNAKQQQAMLEQQAQAPMGAPGAPPPGGGDADGFGAEPDPGDGFGGSSAPAGGDGFGGGAPGAEDGDGFGDGGDAPQGSPGYGTIPQSMAKASPRRDAITVYVHPIPKAAR